MYVDMLRHTSLDELMNNKCLIAFKINKVIETSTGEWIRWPFEVLQASN